MSFSLKMVYPYKLKAIEGVTVIMKRLTRSQRDEFEDREVELQEKATKATGVYAKIRAAANTMKEGDENKEESQKVFDEAMKAMDDSRFSLKEAHKERRAIKRDIFEKAVLSQEGFAPDELPDNLKEATPKEILWEFADDTIIDELTAQALSGLNEEDKKKSGDSSDTLS